MRKAMTPKAVMTQGALIAYLGPKLAQDAKIDLTGALKGLSVKTFAKKKAGIVTAVGKLTEGKLAQDADIGDLTQLLDALEGVKPAEDDEMDDENDGEPVETEQPAKDSPTDAIKEFLKGKLSPEDMARVEEMCGPAAQDEEMTPEEKAAKMKAMGKDTEGPAMKPQMVEKPAMDAAIATAVETATKNALKLANDIRDAERAVRPYVGELAMAHDSVAGVYRTALGVLKVDTKGVHPDALPAILRAQPLPGSGPKPKIAMDASASEGFLKRYPSAARLSAE